MNNKGQDAFSALFEMGRINVRLSTLFEAATPPMADDFDYARVEGMMLGLAIGDALGFPTEPWLPSRRRKAHGEIRDYDQHRAPHGSDDTQLAFWSLEQMLDDGGLIPERLAERLCADDIVGIGSTVRRFAENVDA